MAGDRDRVEEGPARVCLGKNRATFTPCLGLVVSLDGECIWKGDPTGLAVPRRDCHLLL